MCHGLTAVPRPDCEHGESQAGVAEAMLEGHNQGMGIFLLVAAGLAGLALYRFGEVRGAWTRWRTAVGLMRTRRREAFNLSGTAALIVVLGVLALIFAIRA